MFVVSLSIVYRSTVVTCSRAQNSAPEFFFADEDDDDDDDDE